MAWALELSTQEAILIAWRPTLSTTVAMTIVWELMSSKRTYTHVPICLGARHVGTHIYSNRLGVKSVDTNYNSNSLGAAIC